MASNPPTPVAVPPHLKRPAQSGDLLMADLQRKTAALHKQLDPILHDAQNSIEEEDFKRYFLPLFAGEVKEKDKMLEILAVWYRVASSPYSAVNVTANGQIIAIVPPVKVNVLSGKPVMDTNKEVKTLFDDAAHLATLVGGTKAQNVIINGLSERYFKNVPRPDLSKEERAWFDLLNRYGKAPLSMLAKVPPDKAGTKNNGDSNLDDFTVYE
jgi:hypothetical protein